MEAYEFLGAALRNIFGDLLSACLVAEYLVKRKIVRFNNIFVIMASIVGIGFAGISKIIGGLMESINDIFAFFGYGAIAILMYQVIPFRKIMPRISRYSYDIYLLHILVFSTIHQIIPNLVLAAFVSIPITLVLSYYYSIMLYRLKLK